jgi:hypothetical protein
MERDANRQSVIPLHTHIPQLNLVSTHAASFWLLRHVNMCKEMESNQFEHLSHEEFI